MEVNSEQIEELEVLKSIYEGDPCFTIVSDAHFQYKFESDFSFILDILWPKDYPYVLPTISMDAFYNEHINSCVKQAIVDAVLNEANNFLETPMTYSLFEFTKENFASFVKTENKEICDETSTSQFQRLNLKVDVLSSCDNIKQENTKNDNKHLTKSQKRRMWDKGGLESGQRSRGWNWVDLIRHLSQTGCKSET